MHNQISLTKILYVCTLLFSCWLVNLSAYAAENSEPALIYPERLHSGDTVGLISSAFRAPDDMDIQYATERLQALGLKVKYGKNIFKHDSYLAGNDAERAQDVNDMFADTEVKAIFEVRGGWGSNRILPYLNYQSIKEHPKIIIGFSDITALLIAIHARTGLVTYHGTMGIEPWPAFTVNYLRSVLFNADKTVFANPISTDPNTDIIQTNNRVILIHGGTAQGKLIGGNLTVLTSMLASGYTPHWQGSILFVEEIDENYYQIDRMMSQLQNAGVLKQLSGFVFGQCLGCNSNINPGSGADILGSFTLMQILDHYIKPLGIPAWSGAMIGHMPEMFTLPIGAPVEINADKGTITLLQPAVK